MANRPVSTNKAHALAYLEFCTQHEVDPFVLLAEVAKRTFSNPVPQRDLRDYLLSDWINPSNHVKREAIL